MRVNIAQFVRELTAAGIEAAPPMSLSADGQLDFLDDATPQATRDLVLAALAAHVPEQVAEKAHLRRCHAPPVLRRTYEVRLAPRVARRLAPEPF